ncbi:MAG: condensation domain-containing protein, partial [Lutisporaceae bacterium]
NVQPVGVVGELWVGGDGVARGYLNNPELTAEKFIENPFVQGERIYKTGDLARWLSDGTIEFIGRIDNQVKIRGFRIELGEIENELLKHKDIKEAIVIAKEDNSGNKYLCAYIAGEAELGGKEFREHLSKNLPDYMIPAYFIQLEKLPLTENGKVDRKALPEPETDGSIATGTEYVAPTNEIEEKLAEIWSEVLGIQKIGINDSFFELGGHSLKAINIASKIKKVLNASVPLSELFKTPTIKGLADYVKSTKLIDGESSLYWGIEPTEARPYYPASLNQARTYAVQQFDKQNISYNMPCFVRIEGSLDIHKIENAFNEIVQRHEALRTSFSVIEGEIVQTIHKVTDFKINHIRMSEGKCPSAEALVQNYLKPFDLNTVPLLRVNLIELTDEQGQVINKYILNYDMHHIISDGVSAILMLNELMTLYEGKQLPELRLQYKDCTMWQKRIREGGTPEAERMKKQEAYWFNQFEGELPRLTLHTDFPRPSIQSFEGEHLEFKLDEVLTNKLREIGKHTGTTFYMILLAALNVLLSKYSGQEDIVVGSPVSGRTHEDLRNVMGMFINTIVIRSYPQKSKTFHIFLEELKENTLGAFENQDYELGELIERLGIQREVNRNPLFDVMFNMLNFENIERNADDVQTQSLTFTPWSFETKTSKFDITLTASEVEDGMTMNLEYCTKLFQRETMEKMKQHYMQILEAVTENIDVRLEDIVIQYSLMVTETSNEEEDIDFTF